MELIYKKQSSILLMDITLHEGHIFIISFSTINPLQLLIGRPGQALRACKVFSKPSVYEGSVYEGSFASQLTEPPEQKACSDRTSSMWSLLFCQELLHHHLFTVSLPLPRRDENEKCTQSPLPLIPANCLMLTKAHLWQHFLDVSRSQITAFPSTTAPAHIQWVHPQEHIAREVGK